MIKLRGISTSWFLFQLCQQNLAGHKEEARETQLFPTALLITTILSDQAILLGSLSKKVTEVQTT